MKLRLHKKSRKRRPSKLSAPASSIKKSCRRNARRCVAPPFQITRKHSAKRHLRRNPAPSFESLDFPGRKVLFVFDIADRIGCSRRHVFELISEGHLRAVDISCRNTGTSRQAFRIPVESYRQFIRSRII
jgi:hypothetical protein